MSLLNKNHLNAVVLIEDKRGRKIEAYNRGIYELQRKYLSAIQEGIMEFVNS